MPSLARIVAVALLPGVSLGVALAAGCAASADPDSPARLQGTWQGLTQSQVCTPENGYCGTGDADVSRVDQVVEYRFDPLGQLVAVGSVERSILGLVQEDRIEVLATPAGETLRSADGSLTVSTLVDPQVTPLGGGAFDIRFTVTQTQESPGQPPATTIQTVSLRWTLNPSGPGATRVIQSVLVDENGDGIYDDGVAGSAGNPGDTATFTLVTSN